MEKKYKDILQKSTILIVDDDQELRAIFKKTITSYCKKIYEASNGNEALDIYTEYKPNIVITDIKMPLLDGLMFATVLRKLDKKIPIVIISAYSEPETLVKLISLKLENYLIKPVSFEQLTKTLEQCAKELIEKGIFEVQLTNSCKYIYANKSILKNDEIILLTPSEILLMELLIEKDNKLVTKSQIEDTIYNNKFASDNAINTLVSKLRKKIGKNIISAIQSQGYMMIREF